MKVLEKNVCKHGEDLQETFDFGHCQPRLQILVSCIESHTVFLDFSFFSVVQSQSKCTYDGNYRPLIFLSGTNCISGWPILFCPTV